MKLKTRQQIWEEEYLKRRYLGDVSNEEIDRRPRDVSLNLSRILEEAQKLLAHTDSKITQSVYRRKAERITPSKSVFE